MSETRIRIGIAEDQPLYLEMLAQCLESEPDFVVVLKAQSVQEARMLFKETEVDVAILDVLLPDGNGLGLGVSLSRDNPKMGIVLLSNGDFGEWLHDLSDPSRTNWSYLSKRTTTSLSVLREIVRFSAQGQGFTDPSFFTKKNFSSSEMATRLTARQMQILQLVAEGFSNREIGLQLDINESSVINHLTSIYAELEISDKQNPRVVAVLCYLSAVGALEKEY